MTIKAVLGPTNTGKTHLAIERMCGHSSGAIGFPLRLLAREVYDRVVALKGERQVALITGEERIEPKDARYFCCTAEAMPRLGGGHAFVALDEAQIGADRERGHVFTDRLLHARGREETLLLGSSTLEPMVRQLLPRAEITTRPRFSTLSYAGSTKLSRLPPRSAVVAFSAEQVYAVAEMLRRFRGGAAVVMGGLSPETRNKQVALFQSGEVDYIVATDAIGMGLNLDVRHVAFAGLTKFDGVRQRRLTLSEMAQIAGRAGRHQTDGSFGTLSGSGSEAPEFTDEEVYAIEEHRFAPLTSLFWRKSEPRFDTLAALIADLESPPPEAGIVRAPEAIDLAVLKRLADDPLATGVATPGLVRRLWEACSLPDFRQSGPDTHARFVARLWQDLRHGHLGADFIAARIAELDRPQGDIDTLQGRIAAIRTWAYIAQRPDWVLARDEMAARAHAVEARLSDALHARLTERFVNRRTAILMKSLGVDPALLPVALGNDDVVTVEDEPIGHLEGFRFVVDHRNSHSDRRMLLAAAEKALPRLLAKRAQSLADAPEQLELKHGVVCWDRREVARLERGAAASKFTLMPARELNAVPDAERRALLAATERWLARQLLSLAPLAALEAAARDPAARSQARALLLNLVAGHGAIPRKHAGIEHLPRELRPFLRRLGIVFGALDVFAPALLKPSARKALHDAGIDPRPLAAAMPSVLPASHRVPAGYRLAGDQAMRVDVAERLLRAAHEARIRAGGRHFPLDPALAVSTGLKPENWVRLLSAAGFKIQRARRLAAGAFGPPAPDRWIWRPARREVAAAKPLAREGSVFAALADLVR